MQPLLFQYTFLTTVSLISNLQVTKKEKPELLKTVTITPSETTHFRVILSSEAMENETDIEKEDAAPSSSVCTIIKPKPRTPVTAVTMNPLASVSTVTSLSPITPSEPLDVLPSSVATSTPSNSQQSDSPSKKKGGFVVIHYHFFSWLAQAIIVY